MRSHVMTSVGTKKKKHNQSPIWRQNFSCQNTIWLINDRPMHELSNSRYELKLPLPTSALQSWVLRNTYFFPTELCQKRVKETLQVPLPSANILATKIIKVIIVIQCRYFFGGQDSHQTFLTQGTKQFQQNSAVPYLSSLQ